MAFDNTGFDHITRDDDRGRGGLLPCRQTCPNVIVQIDVQSMQAYAVGSFGLIACRCKGLTLQAIPQLNHSFSARYELDIQSIIF